MLTQAIICDLQLLIPDYGHSEDFYYFGFNIATALLFDGTSQEEAPQERDDGVPPELSPWEWDIHGIRLQRVQDGTALNPIDIPLTSRDIISFSSATPITHKDIFRSDLNSYRDGLWRQDSQHRAFLWRPEGLPELPPGDQQRWPALLAELSTRAAAISRALDISFCFRIPRNQFDPEALKTCQLYAAPIFAINKYTFTPEEPNNGHPPHTDYHGLKDYPCWAYKSVGPGTPAPPPRPALAFVHPITLHDGLNPGENSFFNLKELWIEKPKNILGVGSSVWIDSLREKLAASFDLSQRIIDFMRNNQNTSADLIHSTLPFLRRLILTSLHDLAHAGHRVDTEGNNISLRDLGDDGIHVDTEGNSVLRNLIDACSPRKSFPELLKPALCLAATDALYRCPLTLDEWKKLIANQLPEVAALPVITRTDRLRPTTELSAEIDELEKLQTGLQQDATLAKLLYAQWERVAQAETPRFELATEGGRPHSMADFFKAGHNGLLNLENGSKVFLLWRDIHHSTADLHLERLPKINRDWAKNNTCTSALFVPWLGPWHERPSRPIPRTAPWPNWSWPSRPHPPSVPAIACKPSKPCSSALTMPRSPSSTRSTATP